MNTTAVRSGPRVQDSPGLLTTGRLAKLCDLLPYQVLALIRKGLVPEPARVGQFRAWDESAVEVVRAAAVDVAFEGENEWKKAADYGFQAGIMF